MKFIVLLGFLLLKVNFIFSQNIAFPDTFALWYDQIEVVCGDAGTTPSILLLKCHLFEMNGDTSFNSQNYKKIYLYDDTLQTKAFYVGIRSDSLDRVFVYIPDSTSEYIIYDFNFIEGDSVMLTYPFTRYNVHYDTTYAKVLRVDTVFLYGEMRRRAFVCPEFTVDGLCHYWIEGVGSELGLLYYEFESNARTCFGCKWLADFSTTSIINYACGDSMCILLGIDDAEIFTPKVFPNPVLPDNKINIHFEEIKPVKIQITNMLGQTIYLQEFIDQKEIIIKPDIEKGIYILQIFIDGNGYSKKLVKM